MNVATLIHTFFNVRMHDMISGLAAYGKKDGNPFFPASSRGAVSMMTSFQPAFSVIVRGFSVLSAIFYCIILIQTTVSTADALGPDSNH